MDKNTSSKKNSQFFLFIALAGCIFFGIFIVKAVNEDKVYSAIYWASTNINEQSSIGKHIKNIQWTLAANEAIKKQDYETALQLISWNTSEDYYNRWTIQTLIAYKNALQSSVSWLQNAQVFIAQAQQSFDIARKIQKNKTLDQYITNNQQTTKTVSNVIDIKTCYGIGQSIIMNLNDINTIIENTKKTLKEEEEYINKRAGSLGKECYQKLLSIIDMSNIQVQLLQLQMQKNNMTYKSDFTKKIEDPMICITTPYNDILDPIEKGKEGLVVYQQTHIASIEALKSNTPKAIKDLCTQSKNDAQINQQIEQSLQKMLSSLQENKLEEQVQKKSSSEVQYKDFFNQDEKKVLQKIQDINKTRINKVLEIRGKWNYNPGKYIKDMFNQFYGNTGDFINLHK